MLDDADKNGFAHIVSWCADDDGQSFQIHDSGDETFVPILRQYFRQTKYKSFLRQLQGYDIQRITKSGHNNNRCWHPLLLRGHRALCSQMQRKKSSASSTKATTAVAAVATAAPPTRTILSIPKSSSASLTPTPPHLPPTMVSLEEIMLPIENTINRMQANANAVFSDPETTGSHRNNTIAEQLQSNYKDMKNTQQNSDCTADASGAGVMEALRLEIGCTVSSGAAVDSGRIDFDDTLLELVDFDVEEDLQQLQLQQHCQHPSSRDRLMGQWSKTSKNCTTNLGKLGMNILLSTTTNQNKNTNLDKTRTLQLANKKFVLPSMFEPIPIGTLPTSVNRNTIHSNNPNNTTPFQSVPALSSSTSGVVSAIPNTSSSSSIIHGSNKAHTTCVFRPTSKSTKSSSSAGAVAARHHQHHQLSSSRDRSRSSSDGGDGFLPDAIDQGIAQAFEAATSTADNSNEKEKAPTSVSAAQVNDDNDGDDWAKGITYNGKDDINVWDHTFAADVPHPAPATAVPLIASSFAGTTSSQQHKQSNIIPVTVNTFTAQQPPPLSTPLALFPRSTQQQCLYVQQQPQLRQAHDMAQQQLLRLQLQQQQQHVHKTIQQHSHQPIQPRRSLFLPPSLTYNAQLHIQSTQEKQQQQQRLQLQIHQVQQQALQQQQQQFTMQHAHYNLHTTNPIINHLRR